MRWDGSRGRGGPLTAGPDRQTTLQPGPAPVERIESVAGHGRVIDFELQSGVSLNQEIGTGLAALCRRYDLRRPIVRGSLGSLIGAHFADGRVVTDHATEVLVRSGRVGDANAELDMLVIDMQGIVHEGMLQPGENPVCITFEVVLEESNPSPGAAKPRRPLPLAG